MFLHENITLPLAVDRPEEIENIFPLQLCNNSPQTLKISDLVNFPFLRGNRGPETSNSLERTALELLEPKGILRWFLRSTYYWKEKNKSTGSTVGTLNSLGRHIYMYIYIYIYKISLYLANNDVVQLLWTYSEQFPGFTLPRSFLRTSPRIVKPESSSFQKFPNKLLHGRRKTTLQLLIFTPTHTCAHRSWS